MPPKSKSKSTSATSTRQSYRIISMPSTSTASTTQPSPPRPKAASTSKPSTRSRKGKGTPRVLKNAPPLVPGQSAKYRLEQARFQMWSAHPFVAAFCAFAARCAACRERIKGDYRSKTRRFSNTNILRHFGTCKARKAIEAGEMGYPPPREVEEPLEVNDKGARFEVFPGGAPPPGTSLGQRGKRKREDTPEKVEVEEFDLRQPAVKATSNKRRRVSNAEAGSSRVTPRKVVPLRKNAPPRKSAPPRKTAPARKSTPPPKFTPSRTPPPPSTTPPPLPRTPPPPLPVVSEVIDSPSPAPHYSTMPTIDPLPPRFRTRSPFVHHVVPSPVQTPADWDSVESEDGFDDHYSYSGPVTIQQRLSEERSTAGPSSANESLSS